MQHKIPNETVSMIVQASLHWWNCCSFLKSSLSAGTLLITHCKEDTLGLLWQLGWHKFEGKQGNFWWHPSVEAYWHEHSRQHKAERLKPTVNSHVIQRLLLLKPLIFQEDFSVIQEPAACFVSWAQILMPGRIPASYKKKKLKPLWWDHELRNSSMKEAWSAGYVSTAQV